MNKRAITLFIVLLTHIDFRMPFRTFKDIVEPSSQMYQETEMSVCPSQSTILILDDHVTLPIAKGWGVQSANGASNQKSPLKSVENPKIGDMHDVDYAPLSGNGQSGEEQHLWSYW